MSLHMFLWLHCPFFMRRVPNSSTSRQKVLNSRNFGNPYRVCRRFQKVEQKYTSAVNYMTLSQSTAGERPLERGDGVVTTVNGSMVPRSKGRDSDLKGGDSDLNERDSDLNGGDSDLQGRDSDLKGDSDLKERDSDLKGRDSDMKERDSDLKGGDSDLKERESDLKERDSDLKGRDSNLKGRDSDLKGDRPEWR